jgi:hypothetical protein
MIIFLIFRFLHLSLHIPNRRGSASEIEMNRERVEAEAVYEHPRLPILFVIPSIRWQRITIVRHGRIVGNGLFAVVVARLENQIRLE